MDNYKNRGRGQHGRRNYRSNSQGNFNCRPNEIVDDSHYDASENRQSIGNQQHFSRRNSEGFFENQQFSYHGTQQSNFYQSQATSKNAFHGNNRVQQPEKQQVGFFRHKPLDRRKISNVNRPRVFNKGQETADNTEDASFFPFNSTQLNEIKLEKECRQSKSFTLESRSTRSMSPKSVKSCSNDSSCDSRSIMSEISVNSSGSAGASKSNELHFSVGKERCNFNSFNPNQQFSSSELYRKYNNARERPRQARFKRCNKIKKFHSNQTSETSESTFNPSSIGLMDSSGYQNEILRNSSSQVLKNAGESLFSYCCGQSASVDHSHEDVEYMSSKSRRNNSTEPPKTIQESSLCPFILSGEDYNQDLKNKTHEFNSRNKNTPFHKKCDIESVLSKSNFLSQFSQERATYNDEISKIKTNNLYREHEAPHNDSDFQYQNTEDINHSGDDISADLEKINKLLNHWKPSDVILEYRQKIDKHADKCVEQNLREKERISAIFSQKEYGEIVKNLLDNLTVQQKEFDSIISDAKVQLSSLHCKSVVDVIKDAGLIEENVIKECKFFVNFFPAYGIKSAFFNATTNNKVTIIVGDNSYSFNIAVPFFVKAKFEHHVISCEPSELLRARLHQNLNNIFQNEVASDLLPVGENSVENHIFVVTEENLLSYISHSHDNLNLFIILNISLRRSVLTDVLLANLRDILLKQKKWKLVLLLSVYDNPLKFESYFSTTTVSVLRAQNLILPVKTVWKQNLLSPVDDYIDEVAKTALAIHTLQDSGDVLAFLPTISDADLASSILKKMLIRFNYYDVELVLEHEINSYDHYFQKSNQKISPKRKIFFITNSVEMIVIPSVRFVIDSGLKKEYIFDHCKCVDVLSLAFNSRCKAKLRRSFAGISNSGICYRIYNKENYLKEMSHEECPEILTLNPFNTIIKIFQYNPNKAEDIQFIEPLPDDVRQDTMDRLRKFNAIKNKNLTALGKDMVKLPYAAKYSKLLLMGIQWGLAFEAVVLFAFFSSEMPVFQPAQDEEQKKAIDAQKFQLIQNNSDTLTYLYIYEKWIENGRHSTWCNDYYILPKTLESVSAKVDEVCKIVADCLKKYIEPKFSDIKNSYSDIIEMLVDCFQDSLCVFTGRYESGFRVLASHTIAHLDATSVICQKDNMPQFIIFDKIVSKDRDYLIHVTSIPGELIDQLLTNDSFNYNHSDILENNLIQRTIPVGEKLMNQILLERRGQNFKKIEDDIKKETGSDFIFVEPCVQKGCVYIYAVTDAIDYVMCTVEDILKSKNEGILNEQDKNILELKKSNNKMYVKVNWIRGALVKELEIETEGKQLLVNKNNFGISDEFNNRPNSAFDDFIHLTFVRRPCEKGIITFKHEADFFKARKLTMRRIHMLETDVCIEVGGKRNQLVIPDLPPETTEESLKQAFQNILPNVLIENVQLEYKLPLGTPDEDTRFIKDVISKKCEKLKVLDVDILVPQPAMMDMIFEASIVIHSNQDLNSLAKEFSDTDFGQRKLISAPEYGSIIKCDKCVWNALNRRFNLELEKLENQLQLDRRLFRLENGFATEETYSFKLLSKCYDILKLLQRTVSDLLEGQILSSSNTNEIEKLFCHGGHMWLKTLEQIANVYIIQDNKTKIIKLYGLEHKCNKAVEYIKQFLKDAENEVVETVSLSSETKKNVLLKAVIKKYGTNLDHFIEACNLRSAVLDIRGCQLFLHGSRESIEEAIHCIKELSVEPDIGVSDALSTQEICPVCACVAINTYRLEYCHHLYCHECIQGWIEQAPFPIQCCAEGCHKDILLYDIKNILCADEVKIKGLLEKSVKDYLDKNHSNISYCPTPDCPMFFYKDRVVSEQHTCPLCRNEICLKCNVIYHRGYSCEMYTQSKLDPDYSFKVWQKTTAQCKRCPNCQAAVEKIEGCNHMTCKCGAHFCWICIRQYRSGNEVYNHIHKEHRGMLFT